MTRGSDSSHLDAAALEAIVDAVLSEQAAAAEVTIETADVGDDPDAPTLGLTVRPPNRIVCAALEIGIDEPGTAYLTVGRNGAHFELWEKDGQHLSAALREIVDAVVAGRYEEWVSPQGGTRRSLVGIIHSQPKPRSIAVNTTRGPKRVPDGWTHIRYAPYPRPR